MNKIKICTFPNTSLLKEAEIITVFDQNIKDIANSMLELMYECKGVGLAANQVNILKRIFVMNCHGKDAIPYIFINPEIISINENVEKHSEGCLSFPKLVIDITRPVNLQLRWQDFEGAVQSASFSNLEAFCIQHEIDHLNGIVFTDRLSNVKKQMSLSKYSKMRK